LALSLNLASVPLSLFQACKPMRVVHVLDHSIPLHSGYAFRTLSILKEQRALGWETFQLTGPKQGRTRSDEEEVDGWRFHRTQPPGGILEGIPVLGEIELMGEIAHRLEQLVKRQRPHILHAHSPVLNAIPTLHVGRRHGIPVTYEVRAFWEDAAVDHGTACERGLRYRVTRSLETWVLRHVDAVITICEGLRKDILDRGLAADKVTVVPNAVDMDAFSTGQESDPELRQKLRLDGGVVLGFIGSFYAYEGLELLLRAMPKLVAETPSIRLLLVGGGPQESELKRLAAELGLLEKVVFTGSVPHVEVQRYYDLIDVLVYPRLSMRLTELVTPLKPLEAMARGRLVVASDVGGHRELIRPEHNGMLFKAGDGDALVAAVRELLADPERRRVLGSNARSFVETERTWCASAARYRTVYAPFVPAGSL
jgi:PEP-CTERM/exosortase A-associated glycosyltransferase